MNDKKHSVWINFNRKSEVVNYDGIPHFIYEASSKPIEGCPEYTQASPESPSQGLTNEGEKKPYEFNTGSEMRRLMAGGQFNQITAAYFALKMDRDLLRKQLEGLLQSYSLPTESPLHASIEDNVKRLKENLDALAIESSIGVLPTKWDLADHNRVIYALDLACLIVTDIQKGEQ